MATNHEILIRLIVFAAILTAMAWWEARRAAPFTLVQPGQALARKSRHRDP